MIDDYKIFRKCSSNSKNVRNNFEILSKLYSFFENERKKIKKPERKIENMIIEDPTTISRKIEEMNNLCKIINENYMKYYVSKILHENLSYTETIKYFRMAYYTAKILDKNLLDYFDIEQIRNIILERYYQNKK
ncbi:MAG: hypothetical protein QXS41_00930 [Candidatus Woesearchaeota archaeon]